MIGPVSELRDTGEICECPSLLKCAANGKHMFVDEDNLKAIVRKIMEVK